MLILMRIGLFTLQVLIYVTSMFCATWGKPVEDKAQKQNESAKKTSDIPVD